MNKIIFVLCICIIMVGGVAPGFVKANEVGEYAEKVWTIKMDAYVLNESANLENVYVMNSENEKMTSVNIKVNENNAKVIEVAPTKLYEYGVYTVVIEEGLRSSDGAVLKETVQHPFTVNKKMDEEWIKGDWQTYYEYKKMPYDINVTYDNGNATILFTEYKTGFTAKSTKPYTLLNSYMEMNIDELGFKVAGDIYIFSDNEFKIVTKSGKSSYFHKVQ